MTTGDFGQDNSEYDVREGIVKHSTPKSTISSDDTIPEGEAENRNTTETGETIQSSAFLDLNKEERENFQVQNWEDLEQGFPESVGEAAISEEEDPGMAGMFNEGAGAVSGEVKTGRYPRRTGTEKSYRPEEEEGFKDVYDFEDDSFEDNDYVPPSKTGSNGVKVFSPSKPLVEISVPRKMGGISKQPAVKRTPPHIFKARRSPEVEDSWRRAGGHTPDEAAQKAGYGTFNNHLLSLLVHKLAKSKQIDLRKEPLKPGFFKDLVNTYGDLPNTNSLHLAPYKSHQYVMRKWRDNFCTKKLMPNTGTSQADVHLFEDQSSNIPCRLCTDHPQQREDPRDHLLQKLTDQVNDAVKTSAATGESKPKNDKQVCPHCERTVSNIKKHFSENCRQNPNNLIECPRCKMMVIKRSLREHLDGRLDKRSGRVLTKPCQGEDSKKVKCPTCGIMVMNLKRHIRERHQSSKVESSGQKRPADSARPDAITDAKRQKQLMTPLPEKQVFKWSQADILQLTDDLLYKLQVQRSKEDTGGVDQEQMVRLGGFFMERALGIETRRAPFLVDTNGNCLSLSLSFLSNPNQTEELTVEGAAALKRVVVEKALAFIRKAPLEALVPIQMAAAPKTATIGELPLLSRDQLLTLLARYKDDGVWAGDLGDLMPQLYCSFTNTPLFVIAYHSEAKKIIGYFLNPSYVFNQPSHTTIPWPIIHFQHHFEPLVVPACFREAWEAMYESHQEENLGMAAIQLQLTDEDLAGGGGERSDGTGGATSRTTAAAEAQQRQQEQDDGQNLPGD